MPMWTDDLKHFVRYDENGYRAYVISLSNRIHPISDVPIIRHYWEWMRSTETITQSRMIAWHAIICDTIEEKLQRDVDYHIIGQQKQQEQEYDGNNNIWRETLTFLDMHNVKLPSSEQMHTISRGLYNRDFHLLCKKDKALLLIRCAAHNDGFAKKKHETTESWISRYRDWISSGKRARSQKRRNTITHKNQMRNMFCGGGGNKH